MIELGINPNQGKIQLIPRDNGDAKLIRTFTEKIGIFDQDPHLITVTVKRVPSVTTRGRLTSREIFEIKFWKGGMND